MRDVNGGPEPSRSTISVKNVLTVCLTVLAVATVVYIVLQIRLSLTLIIGAALTATALNHLVERLQSRGIPSRSDCDGDAGCAGGLCRDWIAGHPHRD